MLDFGGSFLWLVLPFAAIAACGDANELSLSTPVRAEFTTNVYPVLLRDCAFHACWLPLFHNV